MELVAGSMEGITNCKQHPESGEREVKNITNLTKTRRNTLLSAAVVIDSPD